MQADNRGADGRLPRTVTDCITQSGLVEALWSYADMCARILCAAAENRPVLVRQGAIASTEEMTRRWLDGRISE